MLRVRERLLFSQHKKLTKKLLREGEKKGREGRGRREKGESVEEREIGRYK